MSMVRHAISSLLLAASLPALAAEGMWLPRQAPEIAAELKAAGLAIPPKALADLSAAPMNAIVWLGGCSASFVSPNGLIATNHHCVQGTLQANSSPERNLLSDGLVANRLSDEVPAAPGTRAFVIEALDDVTARMMQGIGATVTGRARTDTLDANAKAIIAACEARPGRRCDVRPYFGGAQYFLQTMLEIQDVRLAYAPAGPVGNFGGEVDNWQWPRHTGDFALYRAWVGPDGNPAPRSDANIPFRPRNHLAIARSDLGEGDFVMIAGFPGTTERFRTLAETRAFYSDIYPNQQRLLTEYSGLLERAAKTDAERIAVASLKARADNIKKKIQGQLDVARSADLIGIKTAQEERLAAWAARPQNRRTHGLAIANHDSMIDEVIAADRTRVIAATLDRALLLRAARDLLRWAHEQQKPDATRERGFQDRDRRPFIDRMNRISAQYVAHIDRASLEQALAEVGTLTPAQRNMGLEAEIAAIGLDRLYADTRLADAAARLAWMDRAPEDFAASDDPFIRVAVAAFPGDMAADAAGKERAGRLHAARVPWMEAVKAHAASEGRALYPDANGSLRITWGQVRGRTIEDGKAWTAFTTPRGLIEKETGEDPFDSPPRLLDQVRARNWGRWASPRLGTL
ncbi:MAG: S46 family peptidase, partial [Thermaurantiacus sp.]